MEAESYAKFEKMRDSGLAPRDVSVAAIADGMDFVENLQMLRSVFRIDLVGAKEAWIQAKGIASSLDEYQQRIIPDIEEALAMPDEK